VWLPRVPNITNGVIQAAAMRCNVLAEEAQHDERSAPHFCCSRYPIRMVTGVMPGRKPNEAQYNILEAFVKQVSVGS